MEGKYYVYMICRSDETPLYIGKGSGDRVYQHFKKGCSSNIHLQRTLGKMADTGDEPIIKFLHHTDCEKTAYELEQVEIAKYGIRRDGGLLVNMTYGGEDPPKNGHMRKTWICLKAQKLLGKVPDQEIADEFFYSKGAVQNFRRRHGIKSFAESKTGYQKRGGNLYDERIHVVFNCVTEEFYIGKRYNFCKARDIRNGHASAFFNGKCARYKDWMYCGTVDNLIREPVVDRKRLDKYKFEHDSGIVFEGYKEDFSREFGIKPSNVTNIYPKSRTRRYNGWRLLGVYKCISADGTCEDTLSDYVTNQEYNGWKNNNR